MHAENLFVNKSSNGEAVETVSESFPEFYVISTFALIIKSVDSIDACTLVVTSEEEEILWVLDFISKE